MKSTESYQINYLYHEIVETNVYKIAYTRDKSKLVTNNTLSMYKKINFICL